MRLLSARNRRNFLICNQHGWLRKQKLYPRARDSLFSFEPREHERDIEATSRALSYFGSRNNYFLIFITSHRELNPVRHAWNRTQRGKKSQTTGRFSKLSRRCVFVFGPRRPRRPIILYFRSPPCMPNFTKQLPIGHFHCLFVSRTSPR